MNNNTYNGFLNIYKESGWTSMDVCAKLRHILHMKKIGHAGTLDPMAEGVLPVALGRATKDVDRIGDGVKTYRAGMLLGLETDTEDITGKVLRTSDGISWPSEEEIREAVMSFLGDYEQLTPMYSARKVDGKKLYQYAREGKEVERKTKAVRILDIGIEEISIPHVRFTVSCTKGTYIRTLCKDIGEKLGCGACMESLTRTRVGDFTDATAKKIEEIEEAEAAGSIDSLLTVKAPTAVSIGKFDGTHMGHQALMRELRKTAQEHRLKTLVLILKFGQSGILTDEERKQKFYDLGIDYCIELPFTKDMMNMSAEDFLEKILIGRYSMKAIVAGDDVSFGRGKQGNADFLRANAEKYGIIVDLIEKVRIDLSKEPANRVVSVLAESKLAAAKAEKKDPDPCDGADGENENGAQVISSTLLRQEIEKGDMLHVTRLLGAPYAITGYVVHGRHLGTERLRIPTMNMKVPPELILPPKGAYAVQAYVADDKGVFDMEHPLHGMSNLGSRPTVDGSDEHQVMLETHLFDESGDFYGKKVKVELCFFIRPEEKFESLEALRQHLEEKDIPAVEAFFAM